MTDMRLELQSFTQKLSDGFVRFQQNGDFVDMTLAAEGHLVKVHKNVLSLSSPYIEEMLRTVPCKHPVIFLSNISHKVLSYILEYVYTGVTKVPKDNFEEFKAACKHLHIVGVRDLMDTSWLTEVKDAQKISIQKDTKKQSKNSNPTEPMPIVKDPLRENTDCDAEDTNDIDTEDTDNDMDVEPNIPAYTNETTDEYTSDNGAALTSKTNNAMYQIDLSQVDLSSKNTTQPAYDKESNKKTECKKKFQINLIPFNNTNSSSNNTPQFQINTIPFNNTDLSSNNTNLSSSNGNNQQFQINPIPFNSSSNNNSKFQINTIPLNNTNLSSNNNPQFQINTIPLNNTNLSSNNTNLSSSNSSNPQFQINPIPFNSSSNNNPQFQINPIPLNNTNLSSNNNPKFQINPIPLNNTNLSNNNNLQFQIHPIPLNNMNSSSNNTNLSSSNSSNPQFQINPIPFNSSSNNNPQFQINPIPLNNTNISSNNKDQQAAFNIIPVPHENTESQETAANIQSLQPPFEYTNITRNNEDNNGIQLIAIPGPDNFTETQKAVANIQINPLPLNYMNILNNDNMQPAFNIIPASHKTMEDQETISSNQRGPVTLNYTINNSEPCINIAQENVSGNLFVENNPPVQIPLNIANDRFRIETNCQVYNVPKNVNNILVEQMLNDDMSESDGLESLSDEYGDGSVKKRRKPLKLDTSIWYMLSIRGAVQLVLNRFVYSTHHKGFSNSRRRWRCIDYRRRKCLAYIDTDDDKITKRLNEHNHGFHDEEINKKGRKGGVFTSFSTAFAESMKRASIDISESTSGSPKTKSRSRKLE